MFQETGTRGGWAQPRSGGADTVSGVSLLSPQAGMGQQGSQGEVPSQSKPCFEQEKFWKESSEAEVGAGFPLCARLGRARLPWKPSSALPIASILTKDRRPVESCRERTWS